MRLAVLAAVALAGLVLWLLYADGEATSPRPGGVKRPVPQEQPRAQTQAQAQTQARARGRVPPLLPGGPRNQNQKGVLSQDDLQQRDEAAWMDLNDALQATRDSREPCIDQLAKELTGPLYVDFSVVLEVVSTTNEVGEEEATIAEVTSQEWPEELSQEVRECFVEAIQGQQYLTSHEYSYRVTHGIRLLLGPDVGPPGQGTP